jgi:bacillithiol biosynthesis cysteine-adding enzyme BshC
VLDHSVSAPPRVLSVDIRRFPWIRRLASDYAFEFGALREFFAGNPADSESWRAAIARVQAHPRRRDALADVLRAQQLRRGAPATALAAADVLRDPASVAVVTGQQAGLFGGPLFTLLKAISALRQASLVRTTYGVPAVAVFWVEAEDHDWDEVKACRVLDAELEPRSTTLDRESSEQSTPIASVTLDEAVERALGELQQLLPPTEFTAGVLEALRSAYRPGTGMADAFARWLDRALGPQGLIVYDASDPAAKPLAAPLFRAEIERPGETSRRAADAGRRLESLGYHAQVMPAEGSVALFHLRDAREPIRAGSDGFRVGERDESRYGLLERVTTSPEEFSPGVLLRPLVQDTLFPTVAYVAGPNELAYLAQLRDVYEAFGVPMPLFLQRASATLVDSNAFRFLSRSGLAFEALCAGDESALNELLAAQLPPTVDAALQEAMDAIERRMTRLAEELPKVDQTLEAAAKSAMTRMQDDLRKLQGKIIQAAKKKDETLRRQFKHARAQAFPGGQPQEREVAFVYFLNKYGLTLVDRLVDELPPEQGQHHVIAI